MKDTCHRKQKNDSRMFCLQFIYDNQKQWMKKLILIINLIGFYSRLKN
jgi:hypothetical protein